MNVYVIRQGFGECSMLSKEKTKFFIVFFVFFFENRKYLEEEEASIEHLEQKFERTLKLCTVMIDSGKEYVKNQRYVTQKIKIAFYKILCVSCLTSILFYFHYFCF